MLLATLMLTKVSARTDGNHLRMGFEVNAKASASGTKPVDVQVRYN